MVELAIDHKAGQCEESEVTNGYFIRRSELEDLCAEVGALDGAEILLVRLAVGGVFVEQVRRACFDLCVQDSEPEVLRFNGLAHTLFLSYWLYSFSNSSPQHSWRPGASCGQKRLHSPFSSTRFMKRSGIRGRRKGRGRGALLYRGSCGGRGTRIHLRARAPGRWRMRLCVCRHPGLHSGQYH